MADHRYRRPVVDSSVPAKPRVAVVFGGRSTEHAISCVSAGNVLAALDPGEFDVVLASRDKYIKFDYRPIDTERAERAVLASNADHYGLMRRTGWPYVPIPVYVLWPARLRAAKVARIG